MSKALMAKNRKHPDQKLSEALKEDAALSKSQKGLIDKRATLIKSPEDSDGEIEASAMAPSDEQLERINQFTRRAVTAEEVVCFSTLSCNDIVDRDDDQFTTQCVKDFAELEQPFSPVGKSFMVDHDYKVSNAVGRIFGVDTKKVNGSLFLTNEVYIPNTAKNQGFIEDQEFGINWAVSVGVMLGKSTCSLSFCDAAFSSFGWWCRNGHDKGQWYTADAEEDSYGWPEPAAPGTKGAEQCIRQFSDPVDFYELSQVFLGAQYYAELEKTPEFASVMKSATSGIPTIGLSAEEARKLPLRHEPDKVSEARVKYEVSEADDGSLVWKDETGLVWSYDPQEPDEGVTSLGKASTDDNEEESDPDDEVREESGSDEPGEGDDPTDPGDQDGDEAVDQSSAGGAGSGGSEGSASSVDGADDTDTESEEEGMSKEAVLAAAKTAKLPAKVIDKVSDAEGNGLEALLLAVGAEVDDLRKEVGTLTEKATLGDAYLKELRAEAIDWYVKAHQSNAQEKVSTATFERLLDRCGDDVELIRSLANEQKETAQAKFPNAVRRSSFPSDPNVREGASDFTVSEGGDDNDQRVQRIHG